MDNGFAGPEIGKYPKRRIVALARDFDMSTRDQIPQLWSELYQREFGVENAVECAAFGVSFEFGEGGKFRYGVGFESTDPQNLPDGACVITLTAGTYAVFRKCAPIAELPQLFDHIFETWLPASDYQIAEGAVFERYPNDRDAKDAARMFEIWVPVTAK